MCSLLLQMRYWRTSSSPRRRRLTHAARPPERPMASSSNAPARRLSFHACLARSMASLAASISSAVNRLVANGPGARMFTTSSTCLSTPVFFATFPAPPRAPRRSAPATDDAMPMTRDRTPDIDDTGYLVSTIPSSVVGICVAQTLTSGPSVLQSRTLRPFAMPGTSLHAYLSLSRLGPSSRRRTYQPSARFSTSCVR